VVRKLLLRNIKGRAHTADLGIDGMIIPKLILEKLNVNLETGITYLSRGDNDKIL